MTNKTQIFGNGKDLVIFWKDYQKNDEMAYTFHSPNEMAYTFHSPIITSMHINVMETPLYLGGDDAPSLIQRTQEPIAVNIDFATADYKMQSSAEGGLMFDLDIFKDVTVSEMFRAINKKLKKREQ